MGRRWDGSIRYDKEAARNASLLAPSIAKANAIFFGLVAAWLFFITIYALITGKATLARALPFAGVGAIFALASWGGFAFARYAPKLRRMVEPPPPPPLDLKD